MEQNNLRIAVANLSGLSNVAQVYHFQATRKLRDGRDELVDIEVHDGGPDCGGGQFTVIAKNEHGRSTSGNSSSTIEEALACVHWHRLEDS